MTSYIITFPLVFLCLLSLSQAREQRKASHSNFIEVHVNSLTEELTCKHSSKAKTKQGVSLEVVHRHGPCSKLSSARTPSHSEILSLDQKRVDSIHARISGHSPAGEEVVLEGKSVNLPARSGVSIGTGNYLVIVGLGTPRKDLSLVFDTDSVMLGTQSSPIIVSGLRANAPCNEGGTIIQLTPNNSTNWVPICDDTLKPHVGLQFLSVEEAEDFYRRYAFICGFEIRVSCNHKSNNIVLRKYFVCTREGKKNGKHSTGKMKTTSNRCGCNAGVAFRIMEGGKYIVKWVHEAHNHAMLAPTMKQFAKSNRKMDIGLKNFVLNCGRAKIGPTRSHKVFKQFVGGYQNIGATATEFKNFRRDLLAYLSGCDVQLMIDILFKKQEVSSAFYFRYDVDEYDQLTRILRADPISMKNYAIYGDVVSFDSTYRTNKYDMVFSPFTGLDNHKKCVTFGGALLLKEDVSSYEWLFESFKEAMGHAPRVLVTDQDPAMKIADRRVFPSTRHRYCMWHIMQNVSKKVGPDLHSPDFWSKLSSVVWSERIECEEFEEKWVALGSEFNLSEKPWFTQLYGIRNSWIPAYFRDILLGGLVRTTSIYESENSFFQKYTDHYFSLVELITHYDSAMDTQRYEQNKLNFESNTKVPDFRSDLELERSCARLFTLTAFYMMQDEMVYGWNDCRVILFDDSGIVNLFNIKDEKGRVFVVEVGTSNDQIVCSCNKFQKKGIPCIHIFLALKDMKFKTLPKCLILSRWTKDASLSPLFSIDGSVIEQCVVMEERRAIVKDVWSDIYSCMALVENDNERLKQFSNIIKEYKNSVVKSAGYTTPSKRDFFEAFATTTEPTTVTVLPPKQAKNKGSRRRYMDGHEIHSKESQKGERKCKKCGKSGYDSRNCEKFNKYE